MNLIKLSTSTIFFTAFLVSILSTAESILCYNCSSNTHIDCSEKFDADNSKLRAVPCNVFEGRYCIKTTGIWDGEMNTKRFCSSRNYGNMCEYIKRIGDDREYRSCVFTCSSDGCNEGSSLYHNLYVSCFSLIIVLILYFLS